MSQISIARALFGAWSCAVGLFAQSNCPDMDVKPIGASSQMAQSGDRCGVSLVVDFGSIKISTTAGYCPLFVIFTPAHNAPYSRPGSHTYVSWIGKSPVVRVDYACEGGFLFFSRSSCTKQGESVVGYVSDYAVYPCADLALSRAKD